jgi:hypothetical protein
MSLSTAITPLLYLCALGGDISSYADLHRVEADLDQILMPICILIVLHMLENHNFFSLILSSASLYIVKENGYSFAL